MRNWKQFIGIFLILIFILSAKDQKISKRFEKRNEKKSNRCTLKDHKQASINGYLFKECKNSSLTDNCFILFGNLDYCLPKIKSHDLHIEEEQQK